MEAQETHIQLSDIAFFATGDFILLARRTQLCPAEIHMPENSWYLTYTEDKKIEEVTITGVEDSPDPMANHAFSCPMLIDTTFPLPNSVLSGIADETFRLQNIVFQSVTVDLFFLDHFLKKHLMEYLERVTFVDAMFVKLNRPIGPQPVGNWFLDMISGLRTGWKQIMDVEIRLERVTNKDRSGYFSATSEEIEGYLRGESPELVDRASRAFP